VNRDDGNAFADPMGDAPSLRLVWGHAVRHLELHAWYWAESVLARAPFHHEAVAVLLRRLDQAMARFSAPDSSAVGWTLASEPRADLVDGLEQVVSVMHELERLYREGEHRSLA